MKDSDFIRIPIKKAIVIQKEDVIVHVIRDRWWGVTSDNCILIYKGYSKQCNTSEAIAEMVCNRSGHPAVKVQFIETVYLPQLYG